MEVDFASEVQTAAEFGQRCAFTNKSPTTHNRADFSGINGEIFSSPKLTTKAYVK